MVLLFLFFNFPSFTTSKSFSICKRLFFTLKNLCFFAYCLSILSQYFGFDNFDVLSFSFLCILRKNAQNFETNKKFFLNIIFKVIICNNFMRSES